MFITLIPKQTTAVTSGNSGELIIDAEKFYSVGATALTADERVGIEFSIDHGQTWQFYRENGVRIELIADQPHMTLDSPGIYRFTKSVTASPCAVVAGRDYYDYKGGTR